MIAAATTASAPASGSAVNALPSLGQTAVSLVLVLVVIFVLAAMLKRLQGVRSGASGNLRIHSGLQVGAKERVLLIEAGGQHLLIGVSAAGVQTLHVYEQAPVSVPLDSSSAASAPAMPAFATTFSDALKRALGQRTSTQTAKP